MKGEGDVDWTKQEVAITGGAGFIGSQLMDYLLRKRGARRIRIIDNLSRGKLDNILDGTVTGYASLKQTNLETTIPVFKPHSVVFHLAAKVTGIEYNRTHQWDMLQANARINLNVAEGVIRQKPDLFVLVSTACVYPHDAPVPTAECFGEKCDPEPTNRGYGIAKWMGEQMARFIFEEAGIPTLVVRFFNAIGIRDYYDTETSHVTPALIRRIMEGEDPVTVWGTGQQSRVFVDAADIAKALVLLAECPDAHNAEPVNIGHDREITIEELAKTIMRFTPYKPELVFDTSRPDGYPRRAASTDRLRALIGWVPDTPLEYTISEMLEEWCDGNANL